MSRKLIAHVGLHKTGTTSIQLACRKNIKLLQSKGYVYPIWPVSPGKLPENHSNIIGQSFSSLIRSSPAGTKSITPSVNIHKERYQSALKRYFQSFDGDVIISAERISTFSEIELEDFKKFFEDINFSIKVFCYLRKPVDWLNSIIAQKVAGPRGPRLTIEEVITDFTNNKSIYVDRVQKLKRTFESVDIYSFENSIKHAGSIEEHFFKQLGIEAKLRASILNHRVSQHGVRIASLINYKIQSEKEHANFPLYNSKIVQLILEMPGSKFQLNNQEAVPILNWLMNDNDWLSEHLGDGFYDENMKFDNVASKLNDADRDYLSRLLYEASEPIKSIINNYLSNH